MYLRNLFYNKSAKGKGKGKGKGIFLTDLTVGTINNDQIQNMDASLVLVFYCAEYFILLQQSGVRAIKWVI